MNPSTSINFTRAYTPPNGAAVPVKFGVAESQDIEKRALSLMMTAAAPKLKVSAPYSSNVSRPFGPLPNFKWQQADDGDYQLGGDWQQANTKREQVLKPWERALPRFATATEVSSYFAKAVIADEVLWTRALPMSSGFGSAYEVLLRHDHLRRLPWEEAVQVTCASSQAFEQMEPIKTQMVVPWLLALPLGVWRVLGFNKGLWQAFNELLPWQDGRKPPPGREPDVKPPVTPPYAPQTDLNFICKCLFPNALSVVLNFGKHPCPLGVVADRKVYFIVNSLSMRRVSDNTPIELASASIGIDSGSWCWSFSGSVPYTEFAKVEPQASGPVEVELEINGMTWRLLVEKYNQREVFAKTDISISGRSVTAWMDSPYAPVRSFNQATSLTSRQFAEAELTRPGLITGFTLDWQLIDPLGWQMPAGTWSYNDLTPVQVMQAIAQGGGGFINSHPSLKQFIVLPEYPAPFWEWDAAQVQKVIPEALIKSRGTDWDEKPAYNGVYVSGEATGVTALVKRTGTAGDFQAPMYVGPMVSAAAAARQKGISILSAGGKQAKVSLSVPMEPSLGLVTPGMLLEVQRSETNKWRGLVRGTAITANWGSGLTVDQSISIERHYGGL